MEVLAGNHTARTQPHAHTGYAVSAAEVDRVQAPSPYPKPLVTTTSRKKHSQKRNDAAYYSTTTRARPRSTGAARVQGCRHALPLRLSSPVCV